MGVCFLLVHGLLIGLKLKYPISKKDLKNLLCKGYFKLRIPKISELKMCMIIENQIEQGLDKANLRNIRHIECGELAG